MVRTLFSRLRLCALAAQEPEGADGQRSGHSTGACRWRVCVCLCVCVYLPCVCMCE